MQNNIVDKTHLTPLSSSRSRRRSILKKLSKHTPPPPMQSSRSFSSGFHQSSSDSLSGSPTQSLSPGPSTPCRSPAPDHSGGELHPQKGAVDLIGSCLEKSLLMQNFFFSSFWQIQVPLLAPAPLTRLSHRPVPVPYTCWVATTKPVAASPPAVSLPHRWPASPLLSPSLRSALPPASPVTPSPCRVSMARLCPPPPSPAILCVPAVQNRHGRRSSRGSSLQRS